MEKFKQFTLPIHTDDRISLIPFELKDQIDFEVKRVYAIVDGKKPTGSHCHKVEAECFICFQGSCVAEVDDGSGLRDVALAQGDAIYVAPYVWHHFKSFTPGTVVVALSSTNYSATREDYIESYDEFRNTVAARV